jgi:Tol biopolymer transport system component
VDRLVVLEDDGTISTCRPDGQGRTVVARGSPHRLHQQPTWSPDGSRIAFSALTRAGGLKPAVVFADPDGGDRMEIPMPVPPFYFQWRPDGRALACVGAGPLGYDLTVVEPGAASRVLIRGSPLFFQWAPDGSAVVANVSDDRLVVATDDGERPLGFAPGTFTAPAWLPFGVVAAVEDGGADGGRVALIDPGSGLERTICR